MKLGKLLVDGLKMLDQTYLALASSKLALEISLTLVTHSFQTSDKNWIPRFVCREQGQVMAFKLVELHNMAVYMDTEAEVFGNLTIAQIRVSNNSFFALSLLPISTAEP